MKALAAVIWCEWLSRKSWFLLAGMIGLLILFTPLLSGDGLGPIEVLVVAISAVFLLCVPAFCAAAGLSLNMRDLNEQRRGFFLSKPIPGILLWAGKFLAGLGLLVVLMAPLLLPGTIAIGVMWSMADPPAGSATLQEWLSNELFEPAVVNTAKLLTRSTRFGLASYLAIFVVTFWAGISLATRRVWLLFDLLILGSSALVVGLAATGMSRLGLEEGGLASAEVAGAAALIAFMVATAVSVSRGGLELGRAARVQSLTLWPLVYVALFSQGLYCHWYLRPQLEDMESFVVLGAPSSGPWVELTGPVQGRHGKEAQFLFNTESGDSVHLRWNRISYNLQRVNRSRKYQPDRPRVSYSRNGNVAAWIARPPWPRSQAPLLHLLRLDESNPQPTSVPLQSDGIVALSPEGGRCAVLGKDNIAVLRTQDILLEETINRAELPGVCHDASFIDEDTLRCREAMAKGIIIDIDLEERSWSTAAKPPTFGGDPLALAVSSPSGDNLVTKDLKNMEGIITFIDARTGEIRGRFKDEKYRSWVPSGFLDEDRVAFFDFRQSGLEIFSAEGQLIQQIAIGQRPNSGLVLVAPETLVFSVFSSFGRINSPPELQDLKAINLQTGQIRKVALDLEQILSVMDDSWWRESRMIVPELGSPISKLYLDHYGRLVFFDVETGERRVLLRPAGSPDVPERARENYPPEVVTQKRSGDEMIALCEALGDVAFSEEPWSEDRWPFTDLPEYVSAEEVIAALDPSGSLQLSPTDRHGNSFEIWISPDPLTDRVMLVRSAGPNGVFEECPWDENTVGIPDCYGDDVVWADGFFVHFPAGVTLD